MLMKIFWVVFHFFAITFIVLMASCKPIGQSEQKETQAENKDALAELKLLTEIPLPEVKGGFDLMATDIEGRRLFVSAEDNHSVEVIDLRHNSVRTSIPNLNEPKWIVYNTELRRLFVATGGDGRVTAFEDSSFTSKYFFTFKEKCNNLRYDSASGLLLVGVGKTYGAIGIIDTRQNKIGGVIPLAAYPKQFELTADFIYVNVPAINSVQIIDRVARKVITNWAVTKENDNVPMALDHNHGRLFIGCQKGKFMVYDIASGKEIARLNIHREADGIYYDPSRSQIYISCGEGYIDVITQYDADHYLRKESIITVEGAATSLYSPELNELFLPVPQKEHRKASLRIYRPLN